MNEDSILQKQARAVSLNPCFRGLSHELPYSQEHNYFGYCLNPCFRGLSHEYLFFIIS